MELFVYGADLSRLGFIEIFEYLKWTRRYQDCGGFELKCPATANNLRLLTVGNTVWKNDETQAAVIETVTLSQEEGAENIQVSGRFAEGLLARRIIEETMRFDGDLSECIAQILDEQVINPANQKRAIPGFDYALTNFIQKRV
jgi:hypothetical protein